nr:immunoglobulin light chain junction region [Macaca mulatta]MOW42486.1 immunoglobulin light chain junction region [Macaca mulatta]MOW44094.1 immunoglobulin light chain junction region [Macaca mulatta]MOW44578.1 immunoglobulin light chain junction region [Macaca mulatta]MOW45048.1 immunoglobulin light chain junction region [Macaca mulatta]
CLQYKSYIRTF